MQDVPVLVAPLTGEGDDVRIGIYCTHQAVDVTVGRVVAGDLRLGDEIQIWFERAAPPGERGEETKR